MVRNVILASSMVAAAHAAGSTCHAIKAAYQDSACCSQTLSKETNYTIGDYMPPAPKLKCLNSEVQSPRDLSMTDATYVDGLRPAKAATLNVAQVAKLPQTNVHFHLGAEHKSDAYNDGSQSAAFDGTRRRLAAGSNGVRPGYMCPTTGLTAAQLTPYHFKYCTGDMAVGKSYEIHYVHSTAGSGTDEEPVLSDGLGTAAAGRGIANPMIAVQGVVVQLVNDNTKTYDDIAHGWDWQQNGASAVTHDNTNSVMYAGSTTGGSYDNEYCSPYTITWHVDKRCHMVSAETFDLMCKTMSEEYGKVNDLAPHDSRPILDPKWVVPASEVMAYA